MKATKDFMSGYKKYDTSEGYGSTFDWKRNFYQRMSKEEAQEILNEDSPYTILGVRQTASSEEIKAAYKRLAVKWHPDHNLGNEEYCKVMFQKINAAYCLLK
jgi:DnaJ-class molecular chaperone